MKIIKWDSDDEHYGNFNESEECLGLFMKFLEIGEVGGSVERQSVKITEIRVNISLPMNLPISALITNVVSLVEEHFNNVEQCLCETLEKGTNSQLSNTNLPQKIS